MSVVVAPRPYTQWDLLDYFIEQLAREGDGVCANRISKDRLYNALVDLVCEGVFGEILERASALRPIYPYVLTSYYLLFDMKDLERAAYLYDRISRGLRSRTVQVDENELESVNALETVIEAFSELRSSDAERHRRVLREHLELLAAIVENSRVLECEDLEEWGCAFRELVAAELDPDLKRSRERLIRVRRAAKEKLSYLREIDEEIAEGYNLILDTAHAPIYNFILGMAEKRLEKLKSVCDELDKLMAKRREAEERSNKILNYMRKLHLHIRSVKEFGDILKLVVPLVLVLPIHFISGNVIAASIPLLAYLLYLIQWVVSRLLNRRLKWIEKEVDKLVNLKVEDISEIVWPS